MYSVLENRAVMQIVGQDKQKFLQGLLSNDINKLTQQKAIYACLLTPQGKYFADFFLTSVQDSIFMDMPRVRQEEICKKLNLYKLRSDVQFIKRDDYKVIAIFEKDLTKVGDIFFQDPRSSEMGIRAFVTQEQLDKIALDYALNSDLYDLTRFDNFIAEGEEDLKAGQSFPLEFGFDELNAIDYQKGCYVGQELVARTHYLGVVRKEIVQVFATKALPEHGALIFANEEKIGFLCSSLHNRGLALIKREAIATTEKEPEFRIEQNEVKLIFKEIKHD